MIAIGAGIALICGLGAGIGIGIATGKIQTTLILGAALSEATAIYGLIGAILIIFMVK